MLYLLLIINKNNNNSNEGLQMQLILKAKENNSLEELQQRTKKLSEDSHQMLTSPSEVELNKQVSVVWEKTICPAPDNSRSYLEQQL